MWNAWSAVDWRTSHWRDGRKDWMICVLPLPLIAMPSKHWMPQVDWTGCWDLKSKWRVTDSNTASLILPYIASWGILLSFSKESWYPFVTPGAWKCLELACAVYPLEVTENAVTTTLHDTWCRPLQSWAAESLRSVIEFSNKPLWSNKYRARQLFSCRSSEICGSVVKPGEGVDAEPHTSSVAKRSHKASLNNNKADRTAAQCTQLSGNVAVTACFHFSWGGRAGACDSLVIWFWGYPSVYLVFLCIYSSVNHWGTAVRNIVRLYQQA